MNNLWAKCQGDTREIEQLLRFRPAGFKFAPSYKAKRWDGYISLVQHRQGETFFPVGLFPHVLAQPWAERYTVIDQRQQPEPRCLYSNTPQVKLDPHQLEAVEEAIAAKRGIVQYPTGTGKSYILGELIRRLQRPALVICDKRDLLHQLARDITKATGSPIGLIGDGHWLQADCCVATYQTLYKRLNEPRQAKDTRKFLSEFPIVIADEGQHAEAKTFSEVLKHIPAYYRFAFSATPFKSWQTGKPLDRGTMLRVQAFIGPSIARLDIEEAIATGRIVPPDIYFIKGCVWEGKAINFQEEYQLGIVKNRLRNKIIGKIAAALKQKGPTVIIVDRTEHGLDLRDALQAPFVYGELSTRERAEHYNAFRTGQEPLLIVSKIADEGLDLPNLEHLILAGGGMAPHRQVQRIGRGMRASAGKERVLVFDFEDYGQYISAHSRRRHRAYEREPAYTLVDINQEEI